jgi:hypothetical protein
MKRIADSSSLNELPPEEGLRLEALLEMFGQDLMGHRNNALRLVYGHLDGSNRSALLPYDQKFFDRAESLLTSEQIEVSRELTTSAIAEFMTFLMTMLTADSRNQPLGRDHGMSYRLLLDIYRVFRGEEPEQQVDQLELEDFDPPDVEPPVPPNLPLESHELGHGGRLHFPKYWNRWQHKYASY